VKYIIPSIICFELNRCEVTWSSVESFSDLYKQSQALLLSPIFFVSGLDYNQLHNAYGWHCNTFYGYF